jgi:hypothetical protein
MHVSQFSSHGIVHVIQASSCTSQSISQAGSCTSDRSAKERSSFDAGQTRYYSVNCVTYSGGSRSSRDKNFERSSLPAEEIKRAQEERKRNRSRNQFRKSWPHPYLVAAQLPIKGGGTYRFGDQRKRHKPGASRSHPGTRTRRNQRGRSHPGIAAGDSRPHVHHHDKTTNRKRRSRERLWKRTSSSLMVKIMVNRIFTSPSPSQVGCWTEARAWSSTNAAAELAVVQPAGRRVVLSDEAHCRQRPESKTATARCDLHLVLAEAPHARASSTKLTVSSRSTSSAARHVVQARLSGTPSRRCSAQVRLGVGIQRPMHRYKRCCAYASSPSVQVRAAGSMHAWIS